MSRWLHPSTVTPVPHTNPNSRETPPSSLFIGSVAESHPHAGVCLSAASPCSVYAIKGRVSGKPIAICVAETGDVATYAEVTVSPEVLRELLPGPVTLVFKRTPMLNPELNPSSETIGIRIPDDRFIRALTTACGTSLALTSANLSGHCSSIQVISSAPALPRFSPFFDSPAPSLPAPLLPAQHHRRHPSCRAPSTRR